MSGLGLGDFRDFWLNNSVLLLVVLNKTQNALSDDLREGEIVCGTKLEQTLAEG